jgi:hypothetical protein
MHSASILHEKFDFSYEEVDLQCAGQDYWGANTRYLKYLCMTKEARKMHLEPFIFKNWKMIIKSSKNYEKTFSYSNDVY